MSNDLAIAFLTPAPSTTSARPAAVVERVGAPLRQVPAVDGRELPPAQEPTEEQLDASTALSQAVSEINSYVQTIRRELQFSIDETLGRTVIKVLDADTHEVVRQIPSEEVLALARHLRQLEDKQVDGLFLRASV